MGLVLLAIAPLPAHSQADAVPAACPSIVRTLSRGMRGADVLVLQAYFVALGLLPGDAATGYFGNLTQGAVQWWQGARGIVSSGTPATTGFGTVGARTRRTLAVCAANAATPLTSSSLGAITTGYQPGGSDYLAYDLGAYGSNATNPNWILQDSHGGIKSVIGSYDLAPATVKSQLQQMCANGQRKIAFVFYFGPFFSSWTPTDGVGDAWIINSTGGMMQPRQQANVRNLMSAVKAATDTSGNTCFNEMQIRFVAGLPVSNDPQVPIDHHDENSATWTAWNESQYQENRNFIFNTRALIESELNTSKIRRFYDLGAEDGGDYRGQRTTYDMRLWKDYVIAYGKGDTYGFSIAPYQNRVRDLIAFFDQAGLGRPDQYAIDVYDQPYNTPEMSANLASVYSQLQAAGEQNKPVIVQETFYSDPVSQAKFAAARNAGLNIRTIMQWQIVRGKELQADGNIRALAVVPPSSYVYTSLSAIAPTPTISSDSMGCDDKKCISIAGARFSTACSVTLYSPGTTNVIATVTSYNDPNTLVCTDSYVAVRIPDPIFNGSAPDVSFSVTNQNGISSAPRYIKFKDGTSAIAPVVSDIGVHCDNHCVALMGMHFSTNCKVTLYSADLTTVLDTVTNDPNTLVCTDSYATFHIPDSIFNGSDDYAHFIISNQAGAWSSPISLQFKAVNTRTP